MFAFFYFLCYHLFGDVMKKSADTLDKLAILADAAKYDVSCASSGVNKSNHGTIGNSKAYGICHSWSSDGRCISLLKILLTNCCIYDCSYCANRSSNNIPRASFTAEEVAELTIQFYRRNYIEGLFLSSAVEINANHTMEKIYNVLRILRNDYKFFGYIHIKVIPGADPLLVQKAGLLADRMSVNIEQPTEQSLQLLAPQKSLPLLVAPMSQIKNEIIINTEERQKSKYVQKFVPAGQSTQMIIGATNDSDLAILKATDALYRNFFLKRVYYSAYIPINEGPNLPALTSMPPLLREHRLYQADWLLRFYHFKVDEIVNSAYPSLEEDYDPKTAWALRNIEFFPVEINRASYEELLRIPGIGTKSALRIIQQRRLAPVQYDHLGKMGVVLKRAKYFLLCSGHYYGKIPVESNRIAKMLKPPEPPQQLQFSF